MLYVKHTSYLLLRIQAMSFDLSASPACQNFTFLNYVISNISLPTCLTPAVFTVSFCHHGVHFFHSPDYEMMPSGVVCHSSFRNLPACQKRGEVQCKGKEHSWEVTLIKVCSIHLDSQRQQEAK